MEKEVKSSLAYIKKAYMTLKQHVNQFEWQQASRFTTKITSYKHPLGLSSNDGYIERQIDIFEQSREVAAISDLWMKDRKLKKFASIKDQYMPQLYDLQDRVWTVVSRDTIVYLIDAGTASYKEIMRQTYLIVVAITVTCFALGNILVFLFWRIRRKIYSVYSILDRVMPFEVQLALDRLAQADSFIGQQSAEVY